MSDTVRITHPERDRTLTVPANLFPGRLAAKGWRLAADQPPRVQVTERDIVHAWNTANAPADPAPSEGDLNAQLDEKAALRAELERLGIEVDGRWGLKRLRTEAETARAAEAAE